MLGQTAIYLAKEIQNMNLFAKSKTDQIATIQQNKIVFVSFCHALADMNEVLCLFTGKDHGLNLYGFSRRFDAICEIANNLKFCAEKPDNWSDGWYDEYPKNFAAIVEDLQEMAKRLDYDMTYNMTVIDNSHSKDYHKMPV
jgi:hypothetical protein